MGFNMMKPLAMPLCSVQLKVYSCLKCIIPFIFLHIFHKCNGKNKEKNVFFFENSARKVPLLPIHDKWAVTCDFQRCGILTCVNSDQPVRSPFKLRNSK